MSLIKEVELQESSLGKEKNQDNNYQKVLITETNGVKEKSNGSNKISRETTDNEFKRNLLFDAKPITIWKLLSHLSEHLDVFCMFIGMLGSFGSGVSLPIVAWISGNAFSSAGEANPSNFSSFFEFAMKMQKGLEDSLMDQVYKNLYIGFGMFASHFLMISMWNLSGQRQVYCLKRKYFSTILNQEQGWFDQHNTFEFATKVQAQLEQVELGLGEKIGNVLQFTSRVIGGLIIALTTSWKLTLVMLCVAPLVISSVIYLLTALKKTIILGRKNYEKAGGIAEELIYNIKTVASFANFDYEKERFNEKIALVYKFDLSTAIKMGASVAFMVFFMYCSFGVAFIYARTLILNHEINSNTGKAFKGGDAFTVILSTNLAVMSIGVIAPDIKTIQESCVAASDYFTLSERVPEIDLSKSIYKPASRDEVKGMIEFRNVTFSYSADPTAQMVLKNINLKFEQGKKIAIVGESGCGKSTIVNLIERLYEATSGEVLVDGINIKHYDLNFLRSFIGYVQQEPVLFNRSIKDNLIFGREEEIKNLGDVEELLKDACDDSYATEFIEQLPEKLGYIVGIKGSKLSGGQKQRLAIARAILCKPKILILDEATSSLDNKSEQEVQRALDNISQKNVTTIIIAHRLSTIKNADLIYAIQNGIVIEQGTHDELIKKNGYYNRLVKSQLAREELESKEENLDKSMRSRKNSMMRHSSLLSLQEVTKTKIAVKPDEVKVSVMRLFAELKNLKCSIVFATIGAGCCGAVHPLFGFMLAKAMNALNSTDRDTIDNDGLKYGLLFFVLAVFNGVANFLMTWKYSTLGCTLAEIFRKKVLSKYLALHMSFYDLIDNSPGALLTRLSIDTMQLNSIILSVTGTLANTCVVAIVGLAMGFSYDWRLTLIILVFLPFISFSLFIRNALRNNSNRRGLQSNIEAGSVLSECVVNTKTIYSFNFQQKAVEMYLECLDYTVRQFNRDSIFTGIFVGLGQFCIFAAHAAVFYASKCFILDGSLTSDNMSLSINVIMMSAGGIGTALGQTGNYKKASVSFKSIYSILDSRSLIDSSKEENTNKMSAKDIKGKIEFRNVTFAYPTRPDQIILKNVSFTINPGQSVALVGYSGCGKSTIIQLLERFYDVDEGKGEILIDDINIKDYNLLELRKRIGLVSQEPILFKKSVMENIRYGNLEASDEECVNAAKSANIEQLLEDDQKNQDDEQSQDLKKKEHVSGGEKQRIAIARTYIKNPAILLLDEATSALDKDSEILVQQTLDKLAVGRTAITIAHRLNTIVNSDIIFVLEAGKIVEKGKHLDLMNLKQKYYTLYKYSDGN